MARLSGQTEITSLVERAYEMNNHHDIDKLLKTNVQRQLAGFNYDRLADRVARRLATDDLKHRPDRSILRSLTVAAAIILGLGTITIVAIYLKSSPSTEVIAPGRDIVEIAESGVESGEVKIHASEKPVKKSEKTTRWCIVTLPEPPVEDVGPDRDNVNIACLF